MPAPAPSHIHTPDSSGLARWAGPGGAWVVFAVLVVVRALAVNRGYFYEGDEISIAAGVAQLMNGDLGPFYRYGPMLGYYRLVQGLASALGGPERIHAAMLVLSVLAGAAIPAAALRAFVSELSVRTRVLTAAILAANPVLWMSSQYGNAAVVSVAFVVLGAVLLSNADGAARRVAGIALFSLGVFVRADAVLAAPVIGLLVHRSTGAWSKTLLTLGAAAAAGALAYAGLSVVDPALGGLLDQVSSHFEDENATLFFENLLWAFSPFVVALAVLGVREGIELKHPVLSAVALWALVPFGFYFSATTTPRYFLLAVFPVSVAAAWGMTSLAELAPRRRQRTAWGLVFGLSFLHLLVGLGHFTARPFTDRLLAPAYGTHDSEMPTGGLLYQAYLRGGLFGRSLRGPAFASRNDVAQALGPAFDRLASEDGPDHVTLFYHYWNGHAAAYHLAAAGARVVDGTDQDGYGEPVRYALGATTVELRPYAPDDIPLPDDLGLAFNDEVWLLRPIPEFPDPRLRAALGAGRTLERTSPPEAYLETFQVRRGGGSDA